MSKPVDSATPHAARVKLTINLPARARRLWVNKITSAQEVVDKAQDELVQTLSDAYEAGVSWSTLAGTMGLHPTTVRKMVNDWRVENGKGELEKA